MKVNTLNPFLEQKEAQARFNICAKCDILRLLLCVKSVVFYESKM